MTYTSEIGYFGVTAVILLLSFILCSRSLFFHEIICNQANSRALLLDGLRGFLAFGVFFHHCLVTYYFYMNGGVWTLPPTAFYTHLGQFAVMLFFMITGYLFWNRILLSGPIKNSNFYISRIRRIVPLYLFTVLCLVTVVLTLTGFRLHVSFIELAGQLFRWISFTLFGTPDINGLENTITIESVYWTLKYEWFFYFSLFILGIFRPVSWLLILFLGLLCYLFDRELMMNFVMGMLAAGIMNSKLKNKLRSKYFFTLGMLCVVYMFMNFRISYGFVQSFLGFIFFLSVLLGNSVFGVLSWPAARLLGTISYSVYLMHNIVIFVVFRFVAGQIVPIETLSPWQFWYLASISGILVFVISTLTYRFIEHRFYVPSFKVTSKTVNS